VSYIGHGIWKLVPAKLEELVTRAIANALKKVALATSYSLSKDGIQDRLSTKRKELGDPFKAADEAAKYYWNWGRGEAAAEGALTLAQRELLGS
jgi:hypothetical protein